MKEILQRKEDIGTVDVDLVRTLKGKLRERSVRFAFLKKDGTVREAKGTRNMNLIPNEHIPKGKDKIVLGTIPFWDLEAEAWKSCREDSLLWVELES